METVLIGANSTKVENGPKRELPHLLATLNILYSQFQANGEDIDSQSGQVPIYSSKIEASYRKKDDFHTKTISKKYTGYQYRIIPRLLYGLPQKACEKGFSHVMVYAAYGMLHMICISPYQNFDFGAFSKPTSSTFGTFVLTLQ